MYYKIEINTEELKAVIYKPLPYYEHPLIVILALDAMEGFFYNAELN